MVQGIVEEGRNLEGQNHRGLTGALESHQGQQKLEYQTWNEAAETASGCMAEGADRNLGTAIAALPPLTCSPGSVGPFSHAP